MHPSKGTNPYGHQPYGSHQTYGQTSGNDGYGVADASLAARIASGPDADVAAYRGHAASHGSQYGGGTYSTAYSSSSLSVAPQVGGVSSKGLSSHAGLSGLGSNLAMTADDYISTSSRGYGVDYAALDRRHYSEHHTGYVPREMPADLERRYADPVGHSHQVASLRQQHFLKAQLPPSSDLRLLVMPMQSTYLEGLGGEKVVNPKLQETTLIQQIFGGQLKSKVICMRCHHESERYENIMDLTLEINGWVESLEDALTQFTSPEDLDGENMYRCERCSAYVRARKQLSVHKVPNILTIVLKRFQSGKYGKINKCLTFPKMLDMIPFVTGTADKPPLYLLYAFIVH